MPIVADAAVAVRGDLSPFNKDLKKAGPQVDGLGKKLDTALSPKSLLLGAAGGFAATQIIGFLGDATQAAGVFQDTVSATGVLFSEEFTPALEAWAETAHSAFGASKQDALDAANSMAVFGKAAGLTGQDLVDFSTELTQLGGDLASFFGGRTEDAITAVGSALRGEFEPIRRYGVLLDDATLRQQAFEMGLISTTKNALTPQQKTLAAHAAILEQTSDAQGDFARTSDGLMNTQRSLEAQWENMQIELGEKLVPIMLELAKVVKDDLLPLFTDLIGLIDTVGGAVSELDSFLGKVGDGIQDDLGIEIDPKEWAFALNDFFTGVEDGATAMSETWAETWEQVPEDVKTSYSEGSTAVREGGADVIDATGEVMDGAIEEVEEGAEVIVGKFGEIPETGADAMLDEQWRLKDATQQLLEFMDQALTPMEEIARIRSFLTSKALAQGLASNNPLIRAKAEEMRDAALARLEELGPRGQAAGAALSRGVATGIDQFSYLAFQATARLAAGVGGFLPRSEPKDPRSALRGITHMGGDWVRMIADDMMANLGIGQRAGMALAGAFAPNLGIPGFTGAGGAAPIPVSMARGAGNTYNVTTASRPREKSTLEIAQEMRRAESLHQLPGLDTHDE